MSPEHQVDDVAPFDDSPGVDATLVGLLDTVGHDAESRAQEHWCATLAGMLTRQLDANRIALASDRLLGEPVELSRPTSATFLFSRTHISGYLNTPEAMRNHRRDIRLALALSGAIAGERVEVPVQALAVPHGILVDGTNLFLDPARAPPGSCIGFDPAAGVVRLGKERLAAVFSDDRIIVKPCRGAWYVSLPYDGDFVSFFCEEESEDGENQRRTLLVDNSPIRTQLADLSRAKELLRIAAPAAWRLVSRLVLYVNWTSGPLRESSTTITDTQGSIILNDRAAEIPEADARGAWLAHGLVHEAKHLQLFLSLRHTLDDVWSLEQLTRPLAWDEIRVPCAWRGRPTLRSMGSHLLALQAFIPGMIAFLTCLPAQRRPCSWLVRRLRMDLRAINGALGAISLARPHLSACGATLLDRLLDDHECHLKPLVGALHWIDEP